MVEVWEEGVTWEHQSLVIQRVEGWWHVGSRETKDMKLLAGHISFTYIRYTKRSAGAVNRSGNIVISLFVLERLRCQ